MSNLIQCECNGWMSPRAIYCPTCGAPAGPAPKQTTKPTVPQSGYVLGWSIAKAFWMALAIVFLVGLFV